VRHWVSYHGVALNVAPDLSHYRGIVPCGISAHGITSLRALGVAVGMEEVDAALRGAFGEVFGVSQSISSPLVGEEGAHCKAMGR
jgi:lipoyl(octanoyl) transferase